MNEFYFYSANGISPNAYDLLINDINANDITPLPYPKPIHLSASKTLQFDWHMFSEMIDQNVHSTNNIGIGHSSGATAILYHAILNPGFWDTIFIIEPALFSKPINYMYKFVRLFQLEEFLHPMIRLTKKRRDRFTSKDNVFKRWRNYPTFAQFTDDALVNFIDSSLVQTDDGWTLRFPKQWEIEIYRSMCALDPVIWKQIHELTSKLVVIAGETSNTFLNGARKSIKPYCHTYTVIPNTTHLLPFESPVSCAKIINHHL